MGTISLNGLVSGLDTQSIIDAYVSVASANLKVMQQHQSDISAKKSLWQTFNGYLKDLKSQIADIDTASEFKKMSVSSADTSSVEAAVTGTALAGTYSVTISSIASNQTSVSNQTWSDTDTFTSSSTLTLTVGVSDPVTTTITLDTNTLDGVISAINDADAGVYAYKVQDATTGDYKLVLSGTNTGADNAFSFSGDGGDFSFNTATPAADTEGTVSGIDVSSSTKDIVDAIPGVTITANAITTGTDVTVSPDLDATKSAINDFVSKYNTVMGFINNQFSYSDTTKSAGKLSGDPTLRGIENTLQSLIRSDYGSNTIDSLSKIGISTNSDGSLSVDDTALTDALNSNLSQVVSFFTGSSGLLQAFSNSSSTGQLDYILDSSSGTVTNKLDSLDSQIDDLSDRIDAEQSRLDKVTENLKNKFAALEVALSTLKATQAYVTNALGSGSSSK